MPRPRKRASIFEVRIHHEKMQPLQAMLASSCLIYAPESLFTVDAKKLNQSFFWKIYDIIFGKYMTLIFFGRCLCWICRLMEVVFFWRITFLAWDFHWWYQTNTGNWAEKHGEYDSTLLNGTYATNPGAVTWSAGNIYYDSSPVYYQLDDTRSVSGW